MRTIALVARDDLTYQGQRVVKGAVFQAAPIDAAVLKYQEKVTFAPRGARSTTAVPAPLPVPVPDEDPVLDASPQPAADPDEKPVRRRRVYKRRDLEAEDACKSSD